MKVSEIREKLAEGKQFAEMGIEFINYLPIIQKKILNDKIVQDSLTYDDNGLVKCDYINKKITMDLGFLLNYTNIELDGENFIDDYDFLEMNGFFQFLQETIGNKETWLISELVFDEIEQRIKIENGIESVIAKALNKLIEKLPNEAGMKSIIKLASKEIKNFDPNKMEQIKEMMKIVK